MKAGGNSVQAVDCCGATAGGRSVYGDGDCGGQSMSSYAMPVSDEGWALMQSVARESETRVRPGAGGWVPHTPTYKPLVWLGLLAERERPGGGIELCLTDFGWAMLSDGLEREGPVDE